MLLDVRPDQLQTVQAILRQQVPQHEVWAFGSRAKWTAKDYSDLDLCIVSDQPLSFKILGALNEAFAESDLPWKVDVVDWATTSESFRKIIERDKVVVQAPPSFFGRADAAGEEMSDESASNGWHYASLHGLGEVNRGRSRHRPRYAEHLYGGPYPFIQTGDVKSSNGRISTYQQTYSEAGLAQSRLWPANTLCITIAANIAETGILGFPACFPDSVVGFIADEKKANVFFVEYALRLLRQRIQSEATGSAQDNINIETLRALKMLVPKKKNEQDRIAYVLCGFDDKIVINRRQKVTVEALARALFQSWFVDFDPVRAKTEDRTPFGLDAKTAALFLEGFEDSDLGEIPAGWSATTLADIVTERTGKVGTGNGHVILSAVASGELKRSDEHFTKQVYSQDTSKYKRVEQWDYAYNPSRINIGSIGMLEEHIVGAVSPVYTVLRPAQGYEWFLRFFLDLPQTKAVINQFCSGSVRQSLSFKDFAAIPVVLPPKAVAEAFSRRWQELNTLRRQLDAQSRQLAEVRDTLLPKLMSGELRVPESLMA